MSGRLILPGQPGWTPPPAPPRRRYGPEWGDPPADWPGIRQGRLIVPRRDIIRAAWGQVQFANPAATNGTGTNHDVAFGSNVATGNRVIVVAQLNQDTGTGSGAVLTVLTASGTASLGTWRQVVQSANLAAGTFSCLAAIWTVPIVTGGSLTVRATGGNAANTWQISSVIGEYSGLDSTDALSCVDVSAVSAWNPGTFSVTTSATHAANELVVGGYASDGATNTITAGSGFTQRGYTGSSNISEAELEDEDSGASGSTPTATWTGATGADKVALIAVFKLASVATARIPYERRVLYAVKRASYIPR